MATFRHNVGILGEPTGVRRCFALALVCMAIGCDIPRGKVVRVAEAGESIDITAADIDSCWSTANVQQCILQQPPVAIDLQDGRLPPGTVLNPKSTQVDPSVGLELDTPLCLPAYNVILGGILHVVSTGGCTSEPALLNLHGGGWVLGSSDDMDSLGAAELSAGVVYASLDYTDAATMNDIAAQVDLAFTTLRNLAGQLGVDPGRIGVIGESAGGQLALMEALGNQAVPWCGSLSGPTDMSALYAYNVQMGAPNAPIVAAITLVMGGTPPEVPQEYDEFSPLNQVPGLAGRAGKPAFYLAYGTGDSIVPYANVGPFVAALQSAGAGTTLRAIQGGDHGSPWGDGNGLGYGPEAIANFLATVGGPSADSSGQALGQVVQQIMASADATMSARINAAQQVLTIATNVRSTQIAAAQSLATQIAANVSQLQQTAATQVAAVQAAATNVAAAEVDALQSSEQQAAAQQAAAAQVVSQEVATAQSVAQQVATTVAGVQQAAVQQAGEVVQAAQQAAANAAAQQVTAVQQAITQQVAAAQQVTQQAVAAQQAVAQQAAAVQQAITQQVTAAQQAAAQLAAQQAAAQAAAVQAAQQAAAQLAAQQAAAVQAAQQAAAQQAAAQAAAVEAAQQAAAQLAAQQAAAQAAAVQAAQQAAAQLAAQQAAAAQALAAQVAAAQAAAEQAAQQAAAQIAAQQAAALAAAHNLVCSVVHLPGC